MRFLDTNIILRYIVRDDLEKAEASRPLIERLQDGSEDMLTSESVVAEVIYVLTSPRQYGETRVDVIGRLRPIVEARGLHFPDKGVVVRALELYETFVFLDFEDALSVAHMESAGISEILSYDQDFDRVDGVARVEP